MRTNPQLLIVLQDKHSIVGLAKFACTLNNRFENRFGMRLGVRDVVAAEDDVERLVERADAQPAHRAVPELAGHEAKQLSAIFET